LIVDHAGGKLAANETGVDDTALEKFFEISARMLPVGFKRLGSFNLSRLKDLRRQVLTERAD